MSTSDPAPTSPDAAGLPADPVRYRRKGLGLAFWLLIAYGVIAIALGVFVARFVPSFWPAKTQTGTSQSPAPRRPAQTEAAPASFASLAPAAEAAPAQDAPPAPAGEGGLAARLAALEAEQERTLSAATTALAASALIQAAQSSRPFSAELSAVEPLIAQDADIATLRRLADAGAPTRAMLAAEFPEAAARAIAAARKPESRAGLFERARYALGSVVTIRRIDNVEGAGPHAVLARAERRVEDGDIEGALAELDALPPAARDALGPWRIRAERRAEIDRRLAAVREAALRSLRELGAAA